MNGFTLRNILTICAAVTFLLPAAAFAQKFTYLPPGDLVSGSGTGRVDYEVYLPGMRYPVEKAPSYPNSQVWGVGGLQGPKGSQCDARNYSYPWRDNYCESRRWSMPLCPSGNGHQGQDIRPGTCANNTHWTVATEGGTITSIGSYAVYHQGDSGIRHRYLHLNHGQLEVTTGQRVEKGDPIGLVSNNFGGTATTIHLHFDMYSGGVYIPPYMSLVRSYEALLGQTRAAVARGVDFDGNGFDDVFWYGPGAASDNIWYSRGHNSFASRRTTIDETAIPIAGDFDGDGIGDILWYGPGTAPDSIYYGAGFNKFTKVSTQVSGASYTPISGDFDGDGRTDILWYGPGSGTDYMWWSEGRTFSGSHITVSGTYTPISGDFNGDGHDDILWYGPGSRTDYMWWGQDRTFSGSHITVSGTYTPISEDFNGDGRTDIFWYGPGSASDGLWLFNKAGGYRYYPMTVSGTYVPFKGDFDGDGIGDIFWYVAGPAEDWIWFGAKGYRFSGERSSRNVSGTYTPIP